MFWNNGTQDLMDQFWALWNDLSYTPDPAKLTELGTKLGEAFKKAGARYSDLAHAQKYVERLRTATESYLKFFDEVMEKCGRDERMERDKKTVADGLIEIDSFFGGLLKVIDNLPD